MLMQISGLCSGQFCSIIWNSSESHKPSCITLLTSDKEVMFWGCFCLFVRLFSCLSVCVHEHYKTNDHISVNIFCKQNLIPAYRQAGTNKVFICLI